MFPLVSNNNIVAGRAFDVGRQCHDL